MPIRDLTKSKNVLGRISEKICHFLAKTEFLNFATCDFSGRPNVAPKFLVKVENNNIYFADYVFGRTFINLKKNPRVSISAINLDTLTGYQINGIARIITGGPEFKKNDKRNAVKTNKVFSQKIDRGIA